MHLLANDNAPMLCGVWRDGSEFCWGPCLHAWYTAGMPKACDTVMLRGSLIECWP